MNNNEINTKAVAEISDEVGYWDCVKECEKAGNRYVENLEMHYVEASNAAYAGVEIKDIPSKIFGFNPDDTLADVFRAVMDQAYEDVEAKSFDF